MALTARAGHTEQPGGKLLSFPIATAVRIYDGAMVGIDTGLDRLTNWVDPTGSNLVFVGIARITEATGVAASAGEAKTGNTAGTEDAAVDVSGVILKNISVAGASATTLGAVVYASDEDTFSITPTGGGNHIGWITQHHTGTQVDVKLWSADTYRAIT